MPADPTDALRALLDELESSGREIGAGLCDDAVWKLLGETYGDR